MTRAWKWRSTFENSDAIILKSHIGLHTHICTHIVLASASCCSWTPRMERRLPKLPSLYYSHTTTPRYYSTTAVLKCRFASPGHRGWRAASRQQAPEASYHCCRRRSPFDHNYYARRNQNIEGFCHTSMK